MISILYTKMNYSLITKKVFYVFITKNDIISSNLSLKSNGVVF